MKYRQCFKTILSIAISPILLIQLSCVSNNSQNQPSLETFTEEQSLQNFAAKISLWQDQRPSYNSSSCSGEDGCIEEVVVTGSFITNNQEEGVDEGDIVKLVGDYIVVLRRGRLFSFSITEEEPVDVIDFIDVAPAEEDIDSWYDEILSYKNTIILLGYSYDVNSTLVRKYTITDTGMLLYGDSYFFTSDDYFDNENYATRLIGNELVFYIPSSLSSNGLSQIQSGRILEGQPVDVGNAFANSVIYKPIQHSDYPILHTVARCPLDQQLLRCQAKTIVGPEAQLLYISNDAVYLWLNSTGLAYDYFMINDRLIRQMAQSYWSSEEENTDTAIVYRLPIDGSEPGLISVRGRPMNQFSFREINETLQVIIQEDLDNEFTQPGILNIPLDQFSTHLSFLSEEYYISLPLLSGNMNVNRFIGSKLLYDDADFYNNDFQSTLLIKDLETNLPPATFDLEHFVERIEPVGDRAIIIGSDHATGLFLTSFDLENYPLKGQTFNLARAVQADERSHSFNFSQTNNTDLIALPVIEVPEKVDYKYFWFDTVYNVQMKYFFLNSDLSFQSLGSLIGESTEEDYCLVSCNDWYGDSRPFFINDRIYALLGYELIEAQLLDASINEIHRENGLELFDDIYLSEFNPR